MVPQVLLELLHRLVGGDHHRREVAVSLVDDHVELLERPWRRVVASHFPGEIGRA
jgi:hypothetical protein